MPLKKNYLLIKRSNVSKVHDTFYILYLSQNFNQEFTAQISVSQHLRLLSALPFRAGDHYNPGHTGENTALEKQQQSPGRKASLPAES